MSTSRTVILLFALALLSCRPSPEPSPPSWDEVVSTSAQAAGTDASMEVKQTYIDTLARYLEANPEDADAVALYRAEELGYARALVARGRYAAAVPHFEHAITRTEEDETLREELRQVRERITITRTRIQQVTKGMTQDQVRQTIGEPRPGWKHVIEKSGVELETWYYKRDDGGVASVSFREGKVALIEHGTILD